MKVSKIKKEDVEKAYDFLIGGKYFEPTGKVSRSKLTSSSTRSRRSAISRRISRSSRLFLPGVTQIAN